MLHPWQGVNSWFPPKAVKAVTSFTTICSKYAGELEFSQREYVTIFELSNVTSFCIVFISTIFYKYEKIIFFYWKLLKLNLC